MHSRGCDFYFRIWDIWQDLKRLGLLMIQQTLGCSGREVIFEFRIFGYWGSTLLDEGEDAYDTDGEGRKASFIEVHFQGK